MAELNRTISIHRFGERAALSILGQDGETVYISQAEAYRLSIALKKASKDINTIPFKDSNFGTFDIEASTIN